MVPRVSSARAPEALAEELSKWVSPSLSEVVATIPGSWAMIAAVGEEPSAAASLVLGLVDGLREHGLAS